MKSWTLIILSLWVSSFGLAQVEPADSSSVSDSIQGVVYEEHCIESYYSEADIAEAIQSIRQSLEDPYLSDTLRTSLTQCVLDLEERVADIRASYNSSAAPSDTVLRLLQEAEEMEEMEQYLNALALYKNAYNLRPILWVSEKIDALKTQAKNQALTRRADSLAEVQRVRDLKNYVPLNGIFTSALYYSAFDYSNTQGLGGVKSDGYSFYISLDYTWWLRESRNLGIHFGASGTYSTVFVPIEGRSQAGGDYSMDPIQWDLGAFLGANIYNYFEVDFFLRGLAIYGYYSYTAVNGSRLPQEFFGGYVHYDGGLRATAYLLKRSRHNLRVSGWYVDTRENSPIKFLSFSNGSAAQTYSLGYRIEFNMDPWAFHLFHSSDAYFPEGDDLNIGLTTVGFGIGYGFGYQ